MNLKEDIRPYQEQDDINILNILKEPGGHFYTNNSIDFSEYNEKYVYILNEELVGFIVLEIHPKISQIICYVSPKYRNQGIGTKLYEFGKKRLNDPNTTWIFFRNDIGHSAKFYQNRGAKPWYSYHHMFFNQNFKNNKLTSNPFDKVINYSSDYFEEYLNGRSDAFFEINKMIDSRPYNEQERRDPIKKWAEDCKNDIWLFLKDDKIIGSIAIYEGFFDEVFVVPTYQGKGFGLAIVNWGLELCNKNGWTPSLSVVTKNIPAINLYEKAGFKTVQTLEMNRIFSSTKEPDLRGPIGG